MAETELTKRAVDRLRPGDRDDAVRSFVPSSLPPEPPLTLTPAIVTRLAAVPKPSRIAGWKRDRPRLVAAGRSKRHRRTG